MSSLERRTGWLVALAVAAVIAVNIAGLWAIALARRAASEEALRLFQGETDARARTLEARLAATRSDLAFLAASSPLARLQGADGSAETRWRREGAEGVLLLFLRSHAEVVRLLVRSPSGEGLLHTGRRGGIPVLWVSSNPTGHEGVALAPDRPRLLTVVSAVPEAGALSLEAELAAEVVLGGEEAAPADRACEVRDAGSVVLARHPLHRAGAPPAAEDPGPPPAELRAESPIAAEGWSAPSPWVLACSQPEARAMALAEPVAARYRRTLGLNLAVMALALLLGGFAIRETRRRERLEARAREEARVRELERQLFHAERLSTVGRLAGGIAHEINNPLEGMANYLSLARSDLSRGDGSAAARRLEGIQEGLDRAAAIVRQVLAHADPARAPRTPLDVNAVLRDTVEFVRSRRDFASVQFGLEMEDGPLLVRGSPVMLGQVASNLVLNACEAQPEGGQVNVRSRRQGSRVVVEIADRGPGVPEQDRQRIFEPFFSTKSSTGLGLSICHSIVRQHDGELTVGPREGGGAVFAMRLPAVED